MSIVKLKARASEFIREDVEVGDVIEIDAVGPAMDDECYQCGRRLSATEGKVLPEPSRKWGVGTLGLYCDPPCREYTEAVSR